MSVLVYAFYTLKSTSTSRNSSSSDQELACATNCLVAVMYASGVNRPPNQTLTD